MSDIRFDGEWVIIEGDATKSATTDLMLDSPGRRSDGGATPFRRALVHDFDDGLTVNWANDYPAGVTVNSTKRINGHNGGDWVDVGSRVVEVQGSDFMLDYAPRRSNTTSFRRALVHAWDDNLVINFNGDYPGGVLIEGPVTMPGGATIGGQDVAAMITSLSTPGGGAHGAGRQAREEEAAVTVRSVRQALNTMGLGGTANPSVMFDVLGFWRRHAPTDPSTGTPVVVSLADHFSGLSSGHVHLNVIEVGLDTLSASDMATAERPRRLRRAPNPPGLPHPPALARPGPVLLDHRRAVERPRQPPARSPRPTRCRTSGR